MYSLRKKWDLTVAAAELDDVARNGTLNVLTALQTVQEWFGYVPEEARDMIARRLNVSRAEVLGVLSFYDDLKEELDDRLPVRICRGEACQAVGAERLFEIFAKRDDINLDDVFCLGNCACGPSAIVGDSVWGRLDEEELSRIIDWMSEEPLDE